MRPRLAIRLAVGLVAGLVAFAAFPATALAHWTDVPFPKEAFSGWVKQDKGYSFDFGVSKVVADSGGSFWAITFDYDTDTDSVYLLRSGANAWERADTGIPMSKESVKAYWDIIAIGQDVFVSCTAGIFRRTASDAAWRATKTPSGVWGHGFVAFDGVPWIVENGPVARYDRTSDSWREVIDGLPNWANGSKWGNYVGASNDSYIYVGLYGGPDNAPDYKTFTVYRLGRGARRWENTGLSLKAPDVWDKAKDKSASGGISGIQAVNGYVAAFVKDGDEYRDMLFDENARTWKALPVAADGYGASLTGLGGKETGTWNRPSDTVIAAPQSYDSAAGTVEMRSYDPKAAAWTTSTQKAYAWAPLWSGSMRVGDDWVVPPPRPDQQPTGFVSSVPLPTEVSRDPKVIGTNAVLALFFAAAFGFTSAMFNNTLKDNYATLRKMTEPIAKVLRGARDALATRIAPLTRQIPQRDSDAGRWRRYVEPLTIVAGTALIYCFLDPGFGLSLAGLGLFVSMGVAVSAVTFSYEGLQSRLATKRYETPAALKIHPAALGVAIVCVLLSRAMAFHPGYVYGMVGGLAFVGSAEPERDSMGRLVLIGSLALLAVSVTAWILMVPVAGWSGGFASELAQGTLAGVFVMGLEGLLFGLMPMRFMDGEKIWDWNRPAWLGLFGVVAFAFWHVLLNRDSKYLESLSNKNVQLMLGLLMLYSMVTLATWLAFRKRAPKIATAPTPSRAIPATVMAPAAAAAAPPPPPPAPPASTPVADAPTTPDTADAFFAAEPPVPERAEAPSAPSPATVTPPAPPLPPAAAAAPPPPRPATPPRPVTVPATAETKTCPMCAEEIKAAAVLCRYCRATFDVARRGYCSACRAVVGAGSEDRCTECGGALADVHLVTTVTGRGT